MRRYGSRILVAAGLVTSGAYLCASGTLGCGSLAADAAISAVDMCFIFDCTNGAIGGLLDPCEEVGGPDGGGDEGGGAGAGVGADVSTFFADCPTEEDQQ